ncbi:MAG: RNA polymerase sigma factor [Halopseudomonas aestusnigri]
MSDHPWLDARFSEIRPKAIAALTRYFRDLELAEEAFSQACIKAMKSWPDKGLPDDPLAWLLAVGRNAGLDILRKQKSADSHKQEAAVSFRSDDNITSPSNNDIDQDELRDDILRLLFVCAHPKLTLQDQSSLALKIVIGLSVEQIARAFLIKPKTMEQRITRAKRTIIQADIPFEIPDIVQRSERLKTVSLMIYLLFNEGWSASSGELQIKTPLCEEAIYLARLLLSLFPAQTELMGLLALFLFQHARYKARINERGELVVLDEQDRTLWSQTLISEARGLLDKALRHGTPGSFQVQAAIAAVHSTAPSSETTDWAEIERLYSILYRYDPTPVVRLNHAVALAKTQGPKAAIEMLKPLENELKNYRWYHSVLGAFFMDTNQYLPARQSYQAAISLAPTDPEKHALLIKIAQCEEKL